MTKQRTRTNEKHPDKMIFRHNRKRFRVKGNPPLQGTEYSQERREGKDNGDPGARLLVGREVRGFVKYQSTKGFMGHYMG